MVTMTVTPTALTMTSTTSAITFNVYSILPASITIPGSVTGDIIRWNETSEAWEVKSEPLIFNGIILNPSTVALSDVEGGLFYKSTDKSVNVCTSAS